MLLEEALLNRELRAPRATRALSLLGVSGQDRSHVQTVDGLHWCDADVGYLLPGSLGAGPVLPDLGTNPVSCFLMVFSECVDDAML
jgi:hypothetical protein